jgi:hypothetical protein
MYYPRAFPKEDGYRALFEHERTAAFNHKKYNYSIYLLYFWSADNGGQCHPDMGFKFDPEPRRLSPVFWDDSRGFHAKN